MLDADPSPLLNRSPAQAHCSAGSSPGRTQLTRSLLSLKLRLTWEGFGAWFGGQPPSLDHFHLQLAAPIHDGNMHVPCDQEEE